MTTQRYFNMDNKLQPLLTLLSLQAAVVQLNSTFYHHATTAYTRRRKDIIQRTVTVPMFSGAISPTLMDNFIYSVVPTVPKLWINIDGNYKRIMSCTFHLMKIHISVSECPVIITNICRCSNYKFQIIDALEAFIMKYGYLSSRNVNSHC